MYFKNRIEAGELLAEKLSKYKNKKEVIVLAIPRGGVETAWPIAKALNVKLDIVVTKKIPLPGNEEAAIGAVGPKGYIEVDREFVRSYGISDKYIEGKKKQLEIEIERRYKTYRGSKGFPSLKDKTVILVDDGIATGHTMKTAIEFTRMQNAKRVIVAVPVMPANAVPMFEKAADEVVCLYPAEFLMAISQFYAEFSQLNDENVRKYLKAK